MLNCQWCDYFKAANSSFQVNSKYVCEYTGFVFLKKVEDYEMENHPCYDYEPNSYVNNNLKLA